MLEKNAGWRCSLRNRNNWSATLSSRSQTTKGGVGERKPSKAFTPESLRPGDFGLVSESGRYLQSESVTT